MNRTSAPGNAGGLFTAGNPFLVPKVASTTLDSEWHNGVQEELLGLIEAAGLVPDATRWDQVRQAILLLTGADGGQLEATRTGSVGPVPGPDFRREMQGAICLLSMGQQKNGISPGITAGATSGPPISNPKNTLADNGYDGVGTDGAEPNEQAGHAWPFQTLGSQMQGDASVDDGWFPRCDDGRGINDYFYPDFCTAYGMFGVGGGRLEIDLLGLLALPAASGTFHFEVVLLRDSIGDWNSGDGGETGNASTFKANKTVSFVSPGMDAAAFGTAKLCRVHIELESFYRRSVSATAHFVVCDNSGGVSPIVDETRAQIVTYGSATKLDRNTTPWKVLFKIDKDDGAAYERVRVCNTPFGGPGTVAPRAIQDGSACSFVLNSARVDYHPPGV